MAIAAVGFAIGRITIKGISLGTAGVFIAAIVFGCFFYDDLAAQLSDVKSALKIVENLGLILFVTSVGFIAGPKFFGNMKKNFKTYVLLGLVIIIAGGIAAVGCIFIGRAMGESDYERLTAMVAGLLSGALTSTPAFSAAKASVGAAYEDIVAVGNGIAYIFSVIGVVLFVQLMPKIVKADMDVERKKLTQVSGGCLLVALVFGHFGRIGKVNIMPPTTTLKVFREFGLVLFLMGVGISGGASFIENFQVIYFFYGVVMTIFPLIIGYIFAKYVLKLSLFNSLGFITGGMTSTPALGTLINVCGTEDVAATYPIALISVVLVSQFLIILF